MSAPWFRPKQSGLGYTPANAKGWAALLLFVLVVIATMVLLGDPFDAKSPDISASMQDLRAHLGLGGVKLALPTRFALVGVEVVAFFVFAQSKSRPPPQALD